jgi:hypothetical protein
MLPVRDGSSARRSCHPTMQQKTPKKDTKNNRAWKRNDFGLTWLACPTLNRVKCTLVWQISVQMLGCDSRLVAFAWHADMQISHMPALTKLTSDETCRLTHTVRLMEAMNFLAWAGGDSYRFCEEGSSRRYSETADSKSHSVLSWLGLDFTLA